MRPTAIMRAPRSASAGARRRDRARRGQRPDADDRGPRRRRQPAQLVRAAVELRHGTPEDAVIVLPFSALEAASCCPASRSIRADIDRMFISLVPPGYVAGSSDPLPARADGWVELSGIDCDGERALIEIGDVLLPPHGVGIATAYDDCFRPDARAAAAHARRRSATAGALVHYLGMSHFFRLGARRQLALAGRHAVRRRPRRGTVVLRRSARRTGSSRSPRSATSCSPQHCPDCVAATRRRRHARADRLGAALGAAVACERRRWPGCARWRKIRRR